VSEFINTIPVYDPRTANVPKRTTLDDTSVKSMSENFLRMLTAQLQNQDPLNPLDNASMTSQLAALNQVDGINRLNTSINSLVAQMQSASFMNLANTVGKTALVAGSKMVYQGEPITLAANLDAAANTLMATVRNEQGEIVTQVNLGAVAAGSTEFVWDGKDDAGNAVPAGLYQLEFKASNAAGEAVNVTSYVGSVIAGIGQDKGNILLTLLDGRDITPQDIFRWMMA